MPTTVAVLKEVSPLYGNLCSPVIPIHMELIWCKTHEPIVVSAVAVPRKHSQGFIIQGKRLLVGPLTEGILQQTGPVKERGDFLPQNSCTPGSLSEKVDADGLQDIVGK